MPALHRMRIGTMFEPHTWSDDASSHVSVRIPLEGDGPRILPRALGRASSLSSRSPSTAVTGA
jgi:hypothetical protein